MSATDEYGASQYGILRRLDAIEARLDAAVTRARALLDRTGVQDTPRVDEPVRVMKAIEAKLALLEERLRQIEATLHEKESPPQTLGATSEFSTGPHYPGLG